MSSYILCKFGGFSKRISPKLLKFSEITEIDMLFQYSEISFDQLHQIMISLR